MYRNREKSSYRKPCKCTTNCFWLLPTGRVLTDSHIPELRMKEGSNQDQKGLTKPRLYVFQVCCLIGLQKHSLKSEALSQVRLRRLRLLLRTALSPSLSACSSLRSATISCCWFCWACWSLVSSILCESTMRWFWEEYLRLNWSWIRGKVPCINVWKEQTKQKTWTTDIVFKNQLCKSGHVLVSSFWHSTSAWRRSILFTMYSRVNGSIPVAWASSLSLSWSADIAAVATILSTYGKPHRFTLMSIWQRPQNLIPKQKWYGNGT